MAKEIGKKAKKQNFARLKLVKLKTEILFHKGKIFFCSDC